MSALGGSIGEGGDRPQGSGGDRQGREHFVNTGYAGIVKSEKTKGMGYDEHGQVATRFGSWPIAYDPVTGAATDDEAVTDRRLLPEQADLGALAAHPWRENDAGGLGDISAPPTCGHATTVAPAEAPPPPAAAVEEEEAEEEEM